MSKSRDEKEALGHELIQLCFKSELNSDDVRSILRCIAEEADTNVRDKWGHTSLMYASRDGHSKVVHELLVRGGANPNMANRCKRAHAT
jgi:ankyrin repeat protein